MEFKKRYYALVGELEKTLKELLTNKTFRLTDNEFVGEINLNKILKHNDTGYDYIRLDASDSIVFSCKHAQHGSHINLDFGLLCVVVDEIAEYVNTHNEFVVKENYTEDEIDEMTPEDMFALELSEESRETLRAIFVDDEKFSDDEYFEEYRKKIKEEYIK